MAITINDIAKIANVSASTVSRVIAGNPRISVKTRERVLKIMKENNYHPNMIARSLASKFTQIIGMIIPAMAEQAFQHPFFPEMLRGAGSIAYQNKYNILIANVNNQEEERQTIRHFARGGITDGIILLTSRVKDPAISELQKMDFPFVLIGRSENDNEINWVDNNNIAIGYQLTQHFIEQGHRKIGFIGVSPNFMVTIDRLNGYKKALQDNGIPVNPGLIEESRFIDDNGYELMRRFLARGAAPTAIIACDDLLAFGAIKVLIEKGLRIPEDMAVAGINNVPQAEYFNPSLTSVEINPFALGAKAFELLLTAIRSEYKSFNRAIVPADLVIRRSSCCRR
ncbi:MAG TPA: LacI family DNA-binding transcriptional regulator [Bacillota bacterium]|nr:LacI family DNA-binding transcriptional regulator [Bacillota bacterium]